jgi:hypothetical protein
MSCVALVGLVILIEVYPTPTSGQTARAQHTMKFMATAARAYAEDNDGHFPPVDDWPVLSRYLKFKQSMWQDN